MRVHRRELLKLGAWAAANGLFLPRLARAQGREPGVVVPINPQRVLIIGAGLSGLVAGFELRKHGHEITILEAQRRPGGRVFTKREPFSDGLYVEVGAARIPDNHDLTLKYVAEFGLPLTPFYPATGSRLYSIGGKRIRADVNGEWVVGEAPLALEPQEKKLGQWELLEKYVAPALAELGDPYRIDYTSAVARKLDSVTTSQYCARRARPRRRTTC